MLPATYHQLPATYYLLDRIHKISFHLIEDHRAEEDDDQHAAKAVTKLRQAYRAGAQEGVAEGFDDGGHGVGKDDPLPLSRNGADRVDDRGGVHQQAYPKLHQKAQVAILGSKRADEDAQTQAESGHHQDEDGKAEDPPVGGNRRANEGEVSHKEQEEDKLDEEGDEVAHQDGNGNSQAREVNLAEEIAVLYKGIAGFCQAFGKVAPNHGSAHIEEEGRQLIGGKLGDVAKDDGKGDGGEQGLNKVPDGAKDGLFVCGHKIAADEEQHQVAVAKELIQAQVKPSALRADDQIPVFGSV